MKYLQQWSIIIFICLTGELLSKVVHIPIPGNVIGMLLLFILLITKTVRLDMVESVCTRLLEHLSFFFLPASVGLIVSYELLKTKMLPFIFICIITTIIVMAVTGLSVQNITKRRRAQ